MEEKNIQYDCSRGCSTERTPQGELVCQYDPSCCKLEVYNWLKGISQDEYKNIFEVRFKNTRKQFYINDSGQLLSIGDLVVVEAATGHDVGIVTLEGPIIGRQLLRNRIDIKTFEFKKIYRKAKTLDLERWQEAIAREHTTMIRSRQIAADLKLNMKIGDVEFQGDGTKAIFYYIADERVDFRQLIKVFAEEFKIRIEMRQIGARQEAGLIGGIGVCGRALCCSNYMSGFKSITTQSARCQDLSLNPQKLAGQCSKLKCCINYEAAIYQDAQSHMPYLNGPLEFDDGPAFLVKTDLLKGVMWFSYDKNDMANMVPLSGEEVLDIIKMNKRGQKPNTLTKEVKDEKGGNEFITSVGDEKIDRFDDRKGGNKKSKNKKHKNHGQPNRNDQATANQTNPASRNNQSDQPNQPARQNRNNSGTPVNPPSSSRSTTQTPSGAPANPPSSSRSTTQTPSGAPANPPGSSRSSASPSPNPSNDK